MLARRLAAYTGVMAARLFAEHEAEQGGAAPAAQRREPVRRVSDDVALAELASMGMLDR